MSSEGYYRFATVCGDLLAFVCEDEIWSVPLMGGIARKLTHAIGGCVTPKISPDGTKIAFVSMDEGHPEVVVMPSEGGAPTRLTYLGSDLCTISGWTHDSAEILFTSDAKSAFFRHCEAFAISPEGGTPRPLHLGHARSFAIDSRGRVVIGRNAVDPALWKRYRGGTAGEMWIDSKGNGEFRQLLKVNGNPVSPMWVGDRIFFLSDHEGIANIYSCTVDGSGLTKHTEHTEYFVRYPSTDGKTIVYTAGARLYRLDCSTGRESLVEVATPSAAPQTARRLVAAKEHLESYSISVKGDAIALISRGQPLTMPLFEGAVVQHGQGNQVRYRLARWLHDGARVVAVNDQDKFERLEIHHVDQSKKPTFATASDIGRVSELVASPKNDLVAITNHRSELLSIDLSTGKATAIDRSECDRINDITWSPDGRWIAYSWSPRFGTRIIRIANAETGKVHDVTDALRNDTVPAFDPEGKYLYFLSTRDFLPVYDSQQFDLNFPSSCRPYLLTLRKDVTSPFAPNISAFIKKSAEEKSDRDKKGEELTLEIDFDGIAARMIAFPVTEGLYANLRAAKGRVLYTRTQVKGIGRDFNWSPADSEAGTLFAYDFEEQRETAIANDVNEFQISADNQTLIYRSKQCLRAIDALVPFSKGTEIPTGTPRHTGWLDVDRANVLVEPRKEWSQMYREAWRLQREQFWDEKMSDVDWDLVFERYALLLPRVRTRSEMSDLIWEMQGELGTSHAYEMGGDHRLPRPYQKGFLGADLEWCPKSNGYLIAAILRGDSWDRDCDSPLAEPGLGVFEGDVIVSVNGRAVTELLSVDGLLLKAGGQAVQLGIKGKDCTTTRNVTVRALKSERYLRYRKWVKHNRRTVHEVSGNRLGYIHIPDMGPLGFAEFHRGFLAEYHKEGLIVDVRYNRGGHVSGLLLQKLARRRVGYDVSRWGQPQPYPAEAPVGPMVALTNQFAGSDGDIFSHCFKLYKLGALVGKRTWGGVIGITATHRLVDGTLTTQPEYSFWFEDVAWSVENNGTDPDHEVDIAPHHYRDDVDTQMQFGIKLAMNAIEHNAFRLPEFSKRPSLKLPTSAHLEKSDSKK